MEAAAAHELALAGQAAQAGASACANDYYVEGLGGESEVAVAAAGTTVDVALVLRPATTLIISGLPAGSTPRSVQRTLEDRGLAGTFDLLYWPAADAAYQGFLEGAWPDAERLAVVNFTAPSFAVLCSWLFQDPSDGVASLAPIQGLEENLSYCGRLAGASPPPGFAPTLIRSATPCPWAARAAEALMLDPEGSTIGGMVGAFAEAPKEIRGQFRKTKLCAFASKRRACNLGDWCPFAHSQEELQPLPDLAKTRLCTAFLRGRCRDRKCRYAHGRKELRATDFFYKTDLCHWWASGSCRLGASCRYAHGESELRGAGGAPPADSQASCWSDASLAFEWALPPAGAFAAEGEERQQQQVPAATQVQGRAGAGESGAERAPEPPAWRVHAIGDDVADCAPKRRPGATEIYCIAGAGVAAIAPGRVLARSNRTFMEAVPIDNEELTMELPNRSFSCGDLDELARALEELESDELDVEDG